MKTLPRSDRSGFSLIDLMAVIVVLGLLMVVCVPAFGRAGTNSKALQCLNNVRQLCNAWRMYADDNRDRIVYASTGAGGGRSGGSVPMSSNPQNPDNYAWSGLHMTSDDAENRVSWDENYDIPRRPLWPYTGKNFAIYKCPEAASANPFLPPRPLSMSMNTYLGGFAGTTGGWDSVNPFFPRIFLKTTEFTPITPARLFVFTDHRPDFFNWSNFMVDMAGYSPSNANQYVFADMPGIFHDGGAAFSFADGHGELHRWQDARTTPPLSPYGSILNADAATPNNPDVAWLQDHASRPR